MTNFHLARIGFLGLRDHVPAISGLDSLSNEPETSPYGISYSVEGELPRKQPLGAPRRTELTPSLRTGAVFQTPSKSLTVVLPRSPVIRARRRHYLDSMRRFIEQGRFKEVLIVAGVDAALRGDEGLNS